MVWDGTENVGDGPGGSRKAEIWVVDFSLAGVGGAGVSFESYVRFAVGNWGVLLVEAELGA